MHFCIHDAVRLAAWSIQGLPILITSPEVEQFPYGCRESPNQPSDPRQKKQVLVTLKYQLLFDDAQNFGWNCTLLTKIYGRLTMQEDVHSCVSRWAFSGIHVCSVQFIFIQPKYTTIQEYIQDYCKVAREPRRNQAPVVEKLGSAIHRINHYPTDKCQENLLRYPENRDLSDGQHYPPFEQLGPEG